MPTDPVEQLNGEFAIEGFARFETGQGGLTCLRITTPHATARLYLHGAHVTDFTPTGQQPVLFMSHSSHFNPTRPIRGGVPICFPWFGPHGSDPSRPAHGFARTQAWQVDFVAHSDDDAVSVQLSLPQSATSRSLHPGDYQARQLVTVGPRLEMAFTVENRSVAPLTYEAALHSYLCVGDIHQARLRGLEGVEFIDKVDSGIRKRQHEPTLGFAGETDRVYVNTAATVSLDDPVFDRQVIVEKDASASTVVWNPWINKATALPDFGDEEWRTMLCIETCNIGENAITLAGHSEHTMIAMIGVSPR